MVYMKLIVPLGFLATASLARPALSEPELAARQCDGCLTGPASSATTGLPLPKAPVSNAHLAARQCDSLGGSSDDFAPACASIDLLDKRSPTYSATDYGSVPSLGTAGGAPSTQDTSNISDCVLSQTLGGTDSSGSCSEVVNRGLSDHLNPTIPDEDDSEE